MAEVSKLWVAAPYMLQDGLMSMPRYSNLCSMAGTMVDPSCFWRRAGHFV